MSEPFIQLPNAPASTRVQDFLDEINHFVADPNLGASLEQLIESHRLMLASGPSITADEKDLVGRLIEDNGALWWKLLTNTFCMQMKVAAKENKRALNGFKWYMRQDFLYIIKNCNYEADRGPKATDKTSFETSMGKVERRAQFAKTLLTTCTAQPPDGLGIPDAVVLSTKTTDALKRYIDFLLEAANSQSWVMAVAATIPCVQSYYLIALDLKTNSAHTDTPWYKLWVIPNSNDDAKQSTEKQKTFFSDNFAQWKDHYAEANEMFQRACKAEIDLWGTALTAGAF